jgi:hypothetical protein
MDEYHRSGSKRYRSCSATIKAGLPEAAERGLHSSV